MRNIKLLFQLIVPVLFLVSCQKTSYKKTPGGMPYKLYRSKDTLTIVPGDYIKLSVIQKINDSVILSTANTPPIYLFISNQNQNRYDVSELWTSMHKGDSLVMVQMMDTFIKRSPRNIPPHFKNGDRIITSIKVIDVYKSDSLAKLDEANVKKAFLANEIVMIEKYLAENKINARKTPSGSFVEIIKPGTGNLIDSGRYLTIYYTGTSWSGKKFDSNVDTSFHHTDPYSFTAGAQQMIQGFDEGMFFLQKGSVAKLYIPSMLAYGASPTSQNIKQYESLKFDLEILDVQEKAPEAPPVPQMQKVDAPQQKNK